MSLLRRLITDVDFTEALEREKFIRVFQHNQIIDNRSIIVRFDDRIVVTQAAVGDLMYHSRHDCEYFLLK